MRTARLFVFAVLGFGLALPAARAQKIGALVDYQGAEIMPLEGVGIVTGLAGTGDKSAGALSVLRDYLTRYDINLDLKDLAAGNVALVRVSATLRPSHGVGQFISAQVSSWGNAKSLKGGNLMHTDLQFGHVNPNDPSPVYARAFGRLTVDPADPGNATLPATESSGALVRRQVGSSAWDRRGRVTLVLKHPEWADSLEIARSVNDHPSFNPRPPTAGFAEPAAVKRIAFPIDNGSIEVQIPAHFRGREPEFIAIMSEIDVTLATPPIIRINWAGQGSLTLSGDVQLTQKTSIAHQGKVITLAPAVAGEPRRYQEQPTQRIVELNGPGSNPDLGELITTLNAMGLTTREVCEVFKSLHQQGALRARLYEDGA